MKKRLSQSARLHPISSRWQRLSSASIRSGRAPKPPFKIIDELKDVLVIDRDERGGRRLTEQMEHRPIVGWLHVGQIVRQIA